MKKNTEIAFLGTLLLSIFCVCRAGAQLNPLSSQYFQNQYLGNPAMAGINGGLQVNLGVRQQWSTIPGAPATQAFTADYRLKNIGLGLNLHNDEAGLLKRTQTSASYAYHLQLNTDQQLHFGLSLGIMYQRVMNERLRGDADDMSVERFNQRDTYIDSDFGIAYTGKGLTLQGSVPNMKQVLQKDSYNAVDRALFFTSISYKFMLGKGEINGASAEPKIAYRGVKGYDNLLDAGVNISVINNRLIFTGMYHSSQSATFGMGFRYENLSFLGVYTTETSALRTYAEGNFEVGLKYSWIKKSE